MSENSRRELLGLGVAAVTVAQAGGALAQAGGSTAPASVAGPGPEALRLVTFAPTPTDRPRVGAVKADGRIVDLSAASGTDPGDMTALIAAGPDTLAAMRRQVAGAEGRPTLQQVHLFAPIPKLSRNVYCVGWNYLEHFAEGQAARETKNEYPEHPVFFTKAVHTLNGPYDPIPFDPNVSTAIDWECELGVVIGRRGRNISEAEAMSYVFGYTVYNDTTARDVQSKKHGGQWFKGKSLDGHGPFGPWIVPAADIDPTDLKLQLRVNGIVKQDASTQQMYFKIPRIIAELSLGLTLEPGDIIATGTPPGVGFARKPPEFLKPGDVMETEIAGLGTLRNVIQSVKA